MTNQELADRLEALAGRLRGIDTPIALGMSTWAFDKDTLVGMVKAIGGKWEKRGWGAEGNGYSVSLASVEYAPLEIHIPRDKVCRKTVTWDCEPLLSAAEEKEVFEAVESTSAATGVLA